MPVWRRGSLALDAATRMASWLGETLPTTAAQFDLLLVLARAAGAAVRTEDLAATLYGTHLPGDTERVRAHVLRLRRQLRDAGDRPPGAIVTVRGYGYRLDGAA